MPSVAIGLYMFCIAGNGFIYLIVVWDHTTYR